MPVIYAMQFLAIQKKVFDRLNEGDQATMREVLIRVYKEINDQSPLDAVNAKGALAKNGIVSVTPNSGEFEHLRKVMADNNREMAKQGLYSLKLLEKMQQYIDEFSNAADEPDSTAKAASGSR